MLDFDLYGGMSFFIVQDHGTRSQSLVSVSHILQFIAKLGFVHLLEEKQNHLPGVITMIQQCLTLYCTETLPRESTWNKTLLTLSTNEMVCLMVWKRKEEKHRKIYRHYIGISFDSFQTLITRNERQFVIAAYSTRCSQLKNVIHSSFRQVVSLISEKTIVADEWNLGERSKDFFCSLCKRSQWK